MGPNLEESAKLAKVGSSRARRSKNDSQMMPWGPTWTVLGDEITSVDYNVWNVGTCRHGGGYGACALDSQCHPLSAITKGVMAPKGDRFP